MIKYDLRLSIIAILTTVLAGCSGEDEAENKTGDEDKTPSNAAEAVMTHISETVQKKGEARNQLGMTRVKQKIRNFWSANGRYPKDLSELQKATGPLPNPGRGFKYQYNPANGNLTVVRAR